MSRRDREQPRSGVTYVERQSSAALEMMMLGAALTGVAITLAFAFMTWNQTRGLEGRFAEVERRIAQLSTKVEQVSARAAAPAQRGPDPNRVYAIKTEGSPFKGSKQAPISIVEFSEFQ